MWLPKEEYLKLSPEARAKLREANGGSKGGRYASRGAVDGKVLQDFVGAIVDSFSQVDGGRESVAFELLGETGRKRKTRGLQQRQRNLAATALLDRLEDAGMSILLLEIGSDRGYIIFEGDDGSVEGRAVNGVQTLVKSSTKDDVDVMEVLSGIAAAGGVGFAAAGLPGMFAGMSIAAVTEYFKSEGYQVDKVKDLLFKLGASSDTIKKVTDAW